MLILFIFLVSWTNADFSPTFNEFLVSRYGKGIADRLARRDLGGGGSYGGGNHKGGTRATNYGSFPMATLPKTTVSQSQVVCTQPIRSETRNATGKAVSAYANQQLLNSHLSITDRRQAVVLVHGITNTASTFDGHRRHFKAVGWGDEHVFGTTYGDGGKTVVALVDMKCDYVKQVRWMIQSVAAYTRRKIDVIGYSMGSPISRKAILGGACVDTGEQLGPPLTGLIDTYVSVAGADHGSFLCAIPFPGACNIVNGMSCTSSYIRDINSRQRYEGKHIYTIYSPQDDKVGHRNACGQVCSSITGSDREFVKSGNHDHVLIHTAQLQINLVDKHDPLNQ